MSRICIIDDDDSVRSALQLLLHASGYQAEGFDCAETFLQTYRPDLACCLIVDVHMPGISGIELMERLAQRGPLPPVIVLTGQADVPLAVRAMKHGALDFLEKPFSDTALLALIDRAESLLEQQRGQLEARERVTRALEALTPREHEIMERVVRGQSNKVIAIDLGISERTVEIHRGRVMKKMGCRSVAELVQCTLQSHRAWTPG
jgi:two-component system response regulator FixJ